MVSGGLQFHGELASHVKVLNTILYLCSLELGGQCHLEGQCHQEGDEPTGLPGLLQRESHRFWT